MFWLVFFSVCNYGIPTEYRFHCLSSPSPEMLEKKKKGTRFSRASNQRTEVIVLLCKKKRRPNM